MEQEPHHTTPAFARQPVTVTVRPISAAETYALRHAVLWPDKPMAYVQLPDDLDGQHFGAFTNGSPAEELVSIISLFIDDSGEARFRKFATAPDWQGKGTGTALLKYTIEAAVKLGATSIWCDARQSALGFYRRFGMSGEGAVFFKGEVPYLRMSRPLP
ncbi:GCN5-like N-acetyltransferase [Hypoxylon rubiginosum]|uniref:GCN5-like N-acetyltransferase n=1 Tax=Hypoxylon rubiginosum TaxID=110542 RepID=A0ACB9YU70_9PEZI|nr:GCN5-like N-acetyltransferase [Hypoxylon rubiginosum]